MVNYIRDYENEITDYLDLQTTEMQNYLVIMIEDYYSLNPTELKEGNKVVEWLENHKVNSLDRDWIFDDLIYMFPNKTPFDDMIEIIERGYKLKKIIKNI